MTITARELRALIAHTALCNEEKTERIGKKNAWIITCKKEKVVVLKSYSTYVAYFDMITNELFVFDQYSTTTTQHVWAFIDLMNEKYTVENILFPYRRSDHVIAIFDYNITGRKDVCKLEYREEDMPFVKRTDRYKASRELRDNAERTGYKNYLCVPMALVDEHVLLTANAQAYERFVSNNYVYTVW